MQNTRKSLFDEVDGQAAKKTSKSSRMSQHQLKRQREWVYLTHFLAEFGWHPAKTFSGSDDGKEPDFTCVFHSDQGDYYVGIELTTLPRLRDRLGNDNLMLKRWFWQSKLQVSTKFTPTMIKFKQDSDAKPSIMQADSQPSLDAFFDTASNTVTTKENVINQFTPKKSNTKSVNVGMLIQQRVAKSMSWLPSAFFMDMTADDSDFPIDSVISQADIDAVMAKKASKVAAYQQKRPLDEVWLLIHTNEQQENGLLVVEPDADLHHHSEFNRVFLTLYPSQRILQVNK